MENTLKPGQTIAISIPESYQVNDLAVFEINAPTYSNVNPETKHWQTWVFRIVAKSGYKIEIKKGEVWLNDTLIPLPDSAKLSYEIASNHEIEHLNKVCSVLTGFKSNDSFLYNVSLTIKGVNDIKKANKDDISIRRPENANNERQNFGPLIIPSPGDIVDIDSSNYYLYQNIPGIMRGRNQIVETLYFVLGDNRDEAQDSRHVGLITHSKMKGIVK